MASSGKPRCQPWPAGWKSAWRGCCVNRVLGHTDQLLFLRLTDVFPDLGLGAVSRREDAVAVLRDPTGRRFYDPVHYEKAVSTVMAALRLVSAAYSPLSMDFTSYRTPFALLSEAQIRSDARPENDPFHDYFSKTLCDRLAAADVKLVGLSMAFPGQIQPGYSLAYALKARFPQLHVSMGGPAVTQLLARFDDARIAGMRGPSIRWCCLKAKRPCWTWWACCPPALTRRR